MAGRLQGKLAINTRAGREGNFSSTICEAYLREGARVVATDFRTDEDEVVSARLARSAPAENFQFRTHDVASEAAEASIAGMWPLVVASAQEDTAYAFVYLGSEEARFVTGASIYHDGAIGQRC